jgi:hypothetical protein
LEADDQAAPLLVDPSLWSADRAHAAALGLNWYLTKAVRFTFDYFHTTFGFVDGVPVVSPQPVLRQAENAFITRFQVAF